MPSRILVLGGGYAGLMTAIRLSRRTGGKADITLVNAADVFVERIRLHQQATKHVQQRPISALLAGTGVRFLQGYVAAIEPDTQRVRLADGRALSFDRLVYALGSRTETTSVPGIAEFAHTLDLDTIDRLKDGLATKGRVTVCGGGLTGIEAATEIAEMMPGKVSLVVRGELAPSCSPRARAHLQRVLDRLGVNVIRGLVSEVRRDAVIVDGVAHPTELCLWAGGFVAPRLAAEAGLTVNARGQIVVDEFLRSVSHPAITAVGDSAAPPAVCGYTYFGCATAMPMASHAADLLAGATVAPFRYRPVIYCISLGRAEGIVQMLREDGTPSDRVFTGWIAARVKESICRFTVRVLRLTNVWAGAYTWAHGSRPAVLPAAECPRLAA